ncbi:12858_t:CDS:2 [Funneliformis geosporum]|nr:12858_t:CDS:2 [Funneliformis geosporum]
MLGSRFLTLMAVFLALVCFIVNAAPAAKPPNPADLKKEEVLVADVVAVKSESTTANDLEPYNPQSEEVDDGVVKEILETAEEVEAKKAKKDD